MSCLCNGATVYSLRLKEPRMRSQYDNRVKDCHFYFNVGHHDVQLSGTDLRTQPLMIAFDGHCR